MLLVDLDSTYPGNNLRLLIESQFTVPQIAVIISVSESEYRLSIHSTYSEMTDHELDSVIADIRVSNVWKQANGWTPTV